MSHGAASCFGVSSSNPEEARARPSAEGNEAYPGGAVSGDGTSRSCSAIPDATEHTAPETKRRRLIPTPPCEPPPLSLLVGYLQRAYGERSRAEEQRKRAEEALRAAEQALKGTATAQREGAARADFWEKEAGRWKAQCWIMSDLLDERPRPLPVIAEELEVECEGLSPSRVQPVPKRMLLRQEESEEL